MALPQVAIIGAGPAGLTLARLLQRQAIPCTIFERDANRYTRRQGGSLDLHEGSGQQALREAGLLDQFLENARPEGEVLKIYDPQGNLLMDESRSEGVKRGDEFKGRPEIDRGILRDILLDSLQEGSIVWGKELRSVDKVSTLDDIKLQFSDGPSDSFDLVIGAEGAWSRARGALSDVVPSYSGVGGLDLKLRMCLTLGQDRGLLAQRNGDGSVRTYAFTRVPEEWYQKYDLRNNLRNPSQVKKEILEEFYSDWDQDAKEMVLQSDEEVWMRPIITLVGDAAHLMTPFAGVGVNVGMQDALELSHEIDARRDRWSTSAERQSAISDSLQAYQTTMWKRAEENAQATWKYLGLFFNPRGAIAMIEHFENMKKSEDAKANVIQAE